MRIDVNALVGEYPWRAVPGTGPEDLLLAMDRVGIDEAWISNLSSLTGSDPEDDNARLYAMAASNERLRPAPTVHPGRADRETVVREAIAHEAPCVRIYPAHLKVHAEDDEVNGLARMCGELGMPLLMTVRLEDIRQRHADDSADELLPWIVRAVVRADPRVRVIVTHADRGFITQVHFGSTPSEAGRVLWDISWIWGPPEDHLAELLRTVGVGRFVFGTGMPLRIPEASVAKLDLLDLTPGDRVAIESENLLAFL